MTLSQRWSSSLCYPRRQERELHAILLFLLRRPQPFTRVLDRHYLASFAYHIWSACNIYYFKVINRNQNTGNNEVNAIKSSTRNLENHLPGIFREKKKKKHWKSQSSSLWNEPVQTANQAWKPGGDAVRPQWYSDRGLWL